MSDFQGATINHPSSAQVEVRQLPYWRFASEQRDRMHAKGDGVEKHWIPTDELIREAWHALDTENKQKYVDASVKQIIEYECEHGTSSFWSDHNEFELRRMFNIHKSEPTSSASVKSTHAMDKSIRKRKRKPSSNLCGEGDGDNLNEEASAGVVPSQIPVFTREFLVHNKNQEMYLKSLRKEIHDVDDERCNLLKHLELLDGETKTLRSELESSQQLNYQMQQAIESIVDQIAEALRLKSSNLEILNVADASSKAVRRDVALKYIRLCSAEAGGIQLSNADRDFVHRMRNVLEGLTMTC